MKATVFDGRAFASEKIEELKIISAGVRSRGVVPHLASILIGDDEASHLYVQLKKKKAEEIGAELDPYFLPEKTELSTVLTLIDTLNSDENVQGIMVQLPIPGELGEHKEEIINKISNEKDIDGLRGDSKFLHPTSKAIMDILAMALSGVKIEKSAITVCVVGSTGMVGMPLVKELKHEGYKVLEANGKTEDLSSITLKANVLISATGVPGLIKPEMVKKDVIVIDVGSPSGDFNSDVEKKALFFTPVPGGVGPVTIACLLENLVEAC